MIGGTAAHLLWRHVSNRAQHHARIRRLTMCRQFGGRITSAHGLNEFSESKVENLCPAIVGDEDVLGLEVSVDDSFFVRSSKPASKLQRVVEHLSLRNRPAK